MKSKTVHLFQKARAIACASLLAGMLAACGGGGGGAADPVVGSPAPVPAPAPAPAPTVINPSLQTLADVGAATYPSGSAQRGAWDVLQGERVACGFGAVAQDTRLDAANDAHQRYLTELSLATGTSWIGHFETAGDAASAWFSGTDPTARAVHAGMPVHAWVSEILTALYNVSTKASPNMVALDEARGAASMRELIGTVYHLTGAMAEGKLAGVGVSYQRGSYALSPTNDFEQYRFGVQVASLAGGDLQKLGTGNVASYPCSGATQVKGVFVPATESPNPFPDVTLTSVAYGTPIYFKADRGSVLTVAAIAVTKVSDGSAVPVRTLTSSTDPAHEVLGHEFFAVPTAALAVGETYRVVANGNVGNAAWAKNFTFQVRY